MSDAQLATIESLLQHSSKMDFGPTKALVTDDYIHYIAPASLGAFGHPDGFSWDDIIGFGKTFYADYKSLEYGPMKDVVRGTDCIAFWYESVGTLHDGKKIKGESMNIYHFQPGTALLKKGIVMTDSLRLYKTAEQMGKALPYHE
ncbi:hypothetical protein P7C70_g8267, partial [Phenoliferia sp. Uapishka_3]